MSSVQVWSEVGTGQLAKAETVASSSQLEAWLFIYPHQLTRTEPLVTPLTVVVLQLPQAKHHYTTTCINTCTKYIVYTILLGIYCNSCARKKIIKFDELSKNWELQPRANKIDNLANT